MGADPVSLGLMATSLVVGAVGSIYQNQAAKAQANAQAQQAQANADIANQNAKLAEDEARLARREGYENKLKKRQEVAGIIGSQRAAQGASGALVDAGSFMDTTLDTIDKGESDALKMEQQGYDAAYQKELEAYNYRNQASQLQATAQDYRNSANDKWGTGLTILGSVAQAGSNWYGKYSATKSLTDNAVGTGNVINLAKSPKKSINAVKF